MPKTFFMVGADTGVGTTFASCAILQAAKNAGFASFAMQPISVGCEQTEQGLRGRDPLQLMQAMSVEVDYDRVNPFPLAAKLPPHIAAGLENKRLAVQRISGLCRGAMMGRHDLMLIEGVGGWRNPLNHVESTASLARDIKKPVILVVGLDPAGVNQAVLTAETIVRDGLSLVGWIANEYQPETVYLEECLGMLDRAIPAPRLAHLPYIAGGDWRQATAAIDIGAWLKA